MAVDWTKPIRRTDTKDSARFLGRAFLRCRDGSNVDTVVVIVNGERGEFTTTTAADTSTFENIPERVVRWANVYVGDPTGGDTILRFGRDSRESADRGCVEGARAGVLRLTFEAGTLVAADIEPAS